MPIYLFECNACGKDYNFFFHMNDKKESTCPDCGKNLKRTYAVSVIPDIQPYEDHTLGHVKSRQHKNKLMKEKGLEYYGHTPMTESKERAIEKWKKEGKVEGKHFWK